MSICAWPPTRGDCWKRFVLAVRPMLDFPKERTVAIATDPKLHCGHVMPQWLVTQSRKPGCGGPIQTLGDESYLRMRRPSAHPDVPSFPWDGVPFKINQTQDCSFSAWPRGLGIAMLYPSEDSAPIRICARLSGQVQPGSFRESTVSRRAFCQLFPSPRQT